MPAIVYPGQSFVDFSRSMGFPWMSRGRRVLLSDLGDPRQIRNHKMRNKKGGFQGFPYSPGHLGALKPSLPIPPVAVVPRAEGELPRLASWEARTSPGRPGHRFRCFCETRQGAKGYEPQLESCFAGLEGAIDLWGGRELAIGKAGL